MPLLNAVVPFAGAQAVPPLSGAFVVIIGDRDADLGWLSGSVTLDNGERCSLVVLQALASIERAFGSSDTCAPHEDDVRLAIRAHTRPCWRCPALSERLEAALTRRPMWTPFDWRYTATRAACRWSPPRWSGCVSCLVARSRACVCAWERVRRRVPCWCPGAGRRTAGPAAHSPARRPLLLQYILQTAAAAEMGHVVDVGCGVPAL